MNDVTLNKLEGKTGSTMFLALFFSEFSTDIKTIFE
jgi:hypothetical protein